MATRKELDPFGENLDVRRLALGLIRSARWIAALTGTGLLAGLGYGLAQPNRYVSEGKIEVRLGIRERRSPESSLDPREDTPQATPGIGDEIELLYNPEVYLRIARQIGPERLLAPYDPTATDTPDDAAPMRWTHAVQTWWFRRRHRELGAAEALLEAAAQADEAIEVTPLQGTNYLWIKSTASSPELARELTRAYVAAARQWHREVYASTGELSFVGDQLSRYEEESVSAESALAQHRERCGFYDIESQKEALVVTIDELEARIQADSIRLIEIEDELAFVERELVDTPALIEKALRPSVRTNPEYQAVFERLQRLNTERASLAAVYTEDSETFQRKAEQLDGQMEIVGQQLARTPELLDVAAPAPEMSANPRHSELTIRRDELRRENETRTRTRGLWEASREERDGRLHAALQCEPVHRDLERVVERAKTRVQELTSALERAQALALLDRQEDMDSLRIAQDGSLPREKAGPNRTRFLTLGLFGGLAAGLFLAALRFLVDQRVHESEALQQELDLPILGVIPEVRVWRKAGAEARRWARDAEKPR